LVANGRGALARSTRRARDALRSGGLDLPWCRRGDGVVALLARVQAFDPALYQTIDAARRTRRA